VADLPWTVAAWEQGRRAGPLDRAVILLAAVTGQTLAEAEGTELGRRDALLAAALTGLAGPVVWARVRCAGCGDRLDVPLDAALLPGLPSGPEQVRAGRGVFRLPHTGDLRVLAHAGGDPATGRQLLLRALLVDGDADPDEVEAALELASPGALVTVAVNCPDCDSSTVAALDVPALLWTYVEARALAELGEIHQLATAYGWSEANVLAVSPARRAVYLALVQR